MDISETEGIKTDSKEDNAQANIIVKTEKVNIDDVVIKEEIEENVEGKYNALCKRKKEDPDCSLIKDEINQGNNESIVIKSVDPSASNSLNAVTCSSTELDENNLILNHSVQATDYTCIYCSFEASDASSLIDHAILHSRVKYVTCPYCNKRTSLKNLKLHLITHFENRPYICHICQYKATRPNNLKRHMKTHTDEKPYACSYCLYRSVSTYNLKRHIMTHTGEKPYVCNTCDYRAAEAKTLKNHMLTHTKGPKPYMCNYCDYSAVVQCNLKRHLMKHTGERPFVCNICNYRATQAISLKRHMAIHIRKNL